MQPTPFRYVALVLCAALLGCETVIDADLDEGPAQLSVDAILTDQPGPQTIRLTRTANYFANGPATPATGANVVVTDDRGRTFAFTDPDNDGFYVWQPAKDSVINGRSTSRRDTLGQIGRTYLLAITYEGDTYRAASRMNRVPPIDSIRFNRERVNPLATEEGYQAEFFATDLPGALDYYRVRFFQNGQVQNRPGNIILVYDASFAGNANTDGLVFIRPIRQSINVEGLYKPGDSVRVELQSISAEGYLFWQELQRQITNGGLFATPPANVPTNVVNTNAQGRPATGFFQASAVRSRSAVVTERRAR